MKVCEECKRPLGDGSGGYQSYKTCKGNCKDSMPPAPQSPNIKKEGGLKVIPEPPKPPLNRLITEGTYGTCPECKSTEIKRFGFFGASIGCIHPECSRYYKK
jgi:RNA polymerase subunit RPABC4/transcription elongation factor Spt4